MSVSVLLLSMITNSHSLPLVEFMPHRKVKVADAIRYLDELPPHRKSGGSVEMWSENSNVQTMAMDDNDQEESKDLFVNLLRHFDARQSNKAQYRPVVVDAKVLAAGGGESRRRWYTGLGPAKRTAGSLAAGPRGVCPGR